MLHYFQKETGICKILSLIDAAQMMPAAEERYEVIQDNRGLDMDIYFWLWFICV